VYVLEDLHWADESTLALLIHFANRIVRLPVVIIGTYRDGYFDSNQALVRTLEELIRMGIRPLKLGGLSKKAVWQMLESLSKRQVPEHLIDIIFEESQGNPFFVEEMYRHLLEEGKLFDADGQLRSDVTIDEADLPENVRLIIGRRLERLEDDEKLALAAAAVIGRSFSFQLLNEISQIGIDELFAVIEKAQQMGIIVPSAEGPERPFTFSHELVRQTLLAGISTPRRQRLHAAVAGAIERLYPAALNERAGEIMDHLLKAGPFADEHRLVDYLMLGGKRALEAAAFEEASRNFRCALTHLTPSDLRERADALMELAIAERGLEHWEVAFANLEQALDIYTTVADREMFAQTCIELTNVYAWAGRLEKAIETAQRGLAFLAGEVSAQRTRLLATLAQTQATCGRYEQAHEALRQAQSIASQLSDPKLMAELAGASSIVNYEFLRLSEAAADIKQSCGSEAPPSERAYQLQLAYQTLLLLGRMEEAAGIRDELESLSSKTGQSYSIARTLITDAWLQFGKAPDVDKLENQLVKVLKSDPKVPSVFWGAFSEAQLSLVDFLRGNWPNAMSHADASYRLEAETFSRGSGTGMLFRQKAYLGDLAGASAILDERRALLPRKGQPNPIGSWWMLGLVIEGLFILGEHSQLRELYPLARELVDTQAVALWPIFRFAHSVAGIGATAAHQWKAAEEHFQTALQQAESIPHRLEEAEIRRFHAMMLIERAHPGDRQRARRMLTEALETYTQIGMHRHREITNALIQ
jgi:tetratricopeptide (TPR) repeat protein